jgi:hypothetical protein
MHVLIRVADVLSACHALEISPHRETFESRVYQRLSKIPVEITFDWTPIETAPANAWVIFDRRGYPMSLPAHLASLAALVEQAIADATRAVTHAMERSPTRAQRWHARAEEFRTIAEAAGTSAGREAYIALASSCQQFAEQIAEFGAIGASAAVDALQADDAAPQEDAA